MSKLTRYTQQVFGSTAGTDQIAQFGSYASGIPAYSTNPATIQALSNYLDGWFAAVVNGAAPAIEDMNALHYLYAYQLAYLMQAGIAEWDSGTTYYENSLVNYSGTIYVSAGDNNLNHTPGPSSSYWKAYGGNGFTSPGSQGNILVSDGSSWISTSNLANVIAFGADPTGGSDSSSAFQAAFNSGRGVWAPPGKYLLNSTINVPNDSAVSSGVSFGFYFTGAGGGQTVLISGSSNTVMFQKVQTNGVVEGAYIGNFTIQAYTSGSTGCAINLSGFRSATIDRINFTNGYDGSNYNFWKTGIQLSAYPYVCYGIVIQNCVFDAVTAHNNSSTSTGILCTNLSQGSSYNPNIVTIKNCWFYSSSGFSTCVDALNSSDLVIEGCEFESNSNAMAVSSGNGTQIRNNWFEGNSGNIDYQSGANGGFAQGNYFSTAKNVDFHSAATGNLWLNNNEPGAQTFTNLPDNSNVKISNGVVSVGQLSFTNQIQANGGVGFQSSVTDLGWLQNKASSQVIADSSSATYALGAYSAGMIMILDGNNGNAAFFLYYGSTITMMTGSDSSFYSAVNNTGGKANVTVSSGGTITVQNLTGSSDNFYLTLMSAI